MYVRLQFQELFFQKKQNENILDGRQYVIVLFNEHLDWCKYLQSYARIIKLFCLMKQMTYQCS